MTGDVLYSVLFELRAKQDATLPATMGHQAHALFLNLIAMFDLALSQQLHNEHGYRPFTVSSLVGVQARGGKILLRRGQAYYLRVTLLDGGTIWHRLCTHFLEAGPIAVSLSSAELQLTRMLSTPSADTTGWVNVSDWHTLATLPAKRLIRLYFASPTAFHMGDREFLLFPESLPLWESLLRVWNAYAPQRYQMDKEMIRTCIAGDISTEGCELHTETLHFPKYVQKGFLGTCQYTVQKHAEQASFLTTLAAFAYYAGVGYKTTMGMGQVQVSFGDSAVE